VRSLCDHLAFDPVRCDGVEAHRQHESGRVDHLDLLPHTRAQRARQMARVAALDYGTRAITSRKKRWQSLPGWGHIAAGVSGIPPP